MPTSLPLTNALLARPQTCAFAVAEVLADLTRQYGTEQPLKAHERQL